MHLEGGGGDDLESLRGAARRREGIAVYDIQPGVIETDMTSAVKDTYERRIAEEGLTLLPRMGQPDEVGRIIATLAAARCPTRPARSSRPTAACWFRASEEVRNMKISLPDEARQAAAYAG